MKKDKEQIRRQLSLSLKSYTTIKDFDFYSDQNFYLNHTNVTLDNNELEVVLITLNENDKILISTSRLHFISKTKVDCLLIHKIDNFGFLRVLETLSNEATKQLSSLSECKNWLTSGIFRIYKKDTSFIDVNIPNSNIGFGLAQAIKKLQFLTGKYEAT